MERDAHRLSIFSQSLDRAAFVAYMLGAVVPLVALAYLTQKYVLPEEADWNQAAGLVGLIVSIGALSLASFLVLRRTARHSLARMAEDNRQLSTILEAARALSVAPHRGEAARALASCARTVTSAQAAFVVVAEKDDEDTPLSVVGKDGEDANAAYEAHRAELEEMARTAIRFGRTSVRAGSADPSARADESALVLIPVGGRDFCTGAIALLGTPDRRGPRPSEMNSLSTLAALGSVSLRNSELQDMQRNFFVHLTDLLVNALDQHLDYHEGHARRVAHISNRIGRELGFDDDRLERLHFAALLHDIGMLKIPTDKHGDKKAARTHPALGHRLLTSIRVWEDLAPFVLYHHEWYNGQGYPEGLSGDDIPLEARIIGLAEAVDSMTSPTSYKEAVTVGEALRRVENSTSTQFDPDVSRVFLDLVRRGEIRVG